MKSHPRSDDSESRLRLQEVFRAAPDPILIVDATGVIVEASGEVMRVFGYEPAALVGQRIEVLVPDARRAAHQQSRAAYQAHPELRPMGRGLPLEARRRDGSAVPVDLTLGPFETPSGRYVAAIVRDISDRKAAEEELSRQARDLAEANRDLEAFAYSVSHDLRTPLRAIQGLGLALEEDFAKELTTVAADYVRRMVAAAQRMDTLILDLLAYSRVGRQERTLRPVSLDAVWHEAREDLPPAHRAAVTIEPQLGEACATPSLMRQVAANLLSNAVKFVAPGVEPRVVVSAHREGDRVRLSVRDNGIGIDPAFHHRIFGVFERLHGIEQYPGTGIGLALVKKSVEAMGGVVGIESAPGAGSTFHIDLASVA